MRLQTKASLALLACLGLLAACHKIVKTDIETFRQNPEKFRGKDVVLVAEIANIKEDPEPYFENEVEVRGQAEYVGFRQHFRWNFLLKDEEGRTLRCYEREYAYRVWSRVELAVRDAENSGEPLTVVGSLESANELEIDWIEFQGARIYTDDAPNSVLHRMWVL